MANNQSNEVDRIEVDSVTLGLHPDKSDVKNPPTKQETWIRFLGQEDPLEKEMATHSSILAWRILWTEWPPSKSLQTINAGEGVEKREHTCTVGGNVN